MFMSVGYQYLRYRLHGATLPADAGTSKSETRVGCMTHLSTVLLWPILAYGGIVLFLVAAMVVLSYFLGERHHTPGRDIPYESGIQPTEPADIRYDARYYLVGVFFILFDVEAAILLAWAVAFQQLGWHGYLGAALFIVTLLLGLAYVWKLGGLDWTYKRTTGRGIGE